MSRSKTSTTSAARKTPMTWLTADELRHRFPGAAPEIEALDELHIEFVLFDLRPHTLMGLAFPPKSAPFISIGAEADEATFIEGARHHLNGNEIAVWSETLGECTAAAANTRMSRNDLFTAIRRECAGELTSTWDLSLFGAAPYEVGHEVEHEFAADPERARVALLTWARSYVAEAWLPVALVDLRLAEIKLGPGSFDAGGVASVFAILSNLSGELRKPKAETTINLVEAFAPVLQWESLDAKDGNGAHTPNAEARAVARLALEVGTDIETADEIWHATVHAVREAARLHSIHDGVSYEEGVAMAAHELRSVHAMTPPQTCEASDAAGSNVHRRAS